APGTVVFADDSGKEYEVWKDGHNRLRIEQAPGEIAGYLHLETGSITGAFAERGIDSLPTEDIYPPGTAPVNVELGDHIADVGTRKENNYHLHMGVNGA